MILPAPTGTSAPARRCRNRSGHDFWSRYWILAVLVWACFVAAPSLADEQPARHLDLWVFWGDGCPHCEEQKPFLADLAARHPGLTIHSHEIWRSDADHALFRTLARFHGIEAGAVPTVFVGGRAFIGDAPEIRRAIEATVEAALASTPPPPANDDPREAPSRDTETLRLPLLGSIDLTAQPLLVTTLAIAFIDGFNPCSLWVLTLLLGLVIHSGSRGRIALVGLTFLATTAAIYGGFIAGLFGLLGLVVHLGWVRWLVGGLAIAMGTIDVKDYFWFKSGPSLTIAERHKPGLYSGIRRLIDPTRSTPALVATTVLMASGAALVELPCTAGFPVVWNGIMLEHGVSGLGYTALLAAYMLVYLLDELVVFAVAVVTMRLARFSEGSVRLLKLLGGSIMLALGLVMLIRPALMNDITGTLLVFVAALTAAGLVDLLHRWWQRRGDRRHPGYR
jgi:thiol-disulfide isomerase/thioredoxin